MKKMRIWTLLVCVIALVSLCCLCAGAETAPADVYISASGQDTNAGTEGAPVQSLNKALELVRNGGTVHIVDSYTAPSDFKWENHNKDVTITGGTLDFTQAGQSQKVDGLDHPFYYQGDAVTFDNTNLVFADDAYYFANGFRLQINEHVTVTGANLQLYGGGANGKTVSGTHVTLLGGNYKMIYGGGYKSNVSGNVYLYVGKVNASYKVSHDGATRLYGGSDAGKVYGNIDLTIAGANIDRICGGNEKSGAASAGDITVRMTGGAAFSLYGGHYYASGVQTGNISLTLSGGTVSQVFGADNNSGHQGDVDVNLVGGTITRRFLGGCYNEYDFSYATDYHVAGNIRVYIHEGMSFSWKSENLTDDHGVYARSRYNKQFADEHTYIYFMGQRAENLLEGKLGAQNLMMSAAMDSVTAADNINIYEIKDMTDVVKNWNIVLGDDIGANFLVDLPEAVAKVSQMRIIVGSRTQTYDLSKLRPNKEGLYVVSTNVEATQMTEAITLQLVVNGTEYDPISVNVRQYAETILNDNAYSPKAKDLLRHTLNYGAAAQAYFGVNTGKLANAGYEVNYEAQLPEGYTKVDRSGKVSGLKTVGAALVLKSKITLRYVFEADSLEGVTFKANGKTYTATEDNGQYYVDIPGINPDQYAQNVVLHATKGEETLTVSYSPMHYIVRMYGKTENPAMKVLANAMLGYSQMATEYVANTNATVTISEVTGGQVVSNKTSYLPGQTVTLTVTPDAGYDLRSLTVKKDGIEVNVGQISVLGGNYTFVAQTGNYTVEATFAPRTFEYSPYWDMTQQYDGVIILLQGASEARTARTTLNTHRQIEVTVRDYESVTFKTELHFVFGEGKEFQIRLHNENTGGEYRVQKMETTLSSGWKNLYTLNDEEVALLKGETGIKFRVALVGTKAIAYLNSVKVGEVDLSDKITAEDTAEIRVVLYGNERENNISIPFAVTSGPKIFQDTEHWDLTKQNEGSVTILMGYEKGRTLITQANTYRDISVGVRHYDENTFKTEFHFVFGDGREFQIRLHNEGTNGAYKVQKMSTSLVSGWSNLYTLSDAEVALLKSETGITFRVSIIGTCAYAYLNDALVGQVDLTNKISATETAQVKIIIYGNDGEENIAVPFALSSDPAHADVTVAEGITNGTIGVDKAIYAVGETITLTATPEEGYYLKSLVVKKNGQEVDVGAIVLGGGTYTFTAEKGNYTVEAAFAKKIFQDSANWDLSKQDECTLSLPAKPEKEMVVSTVDAIYRDAAVTVKDHQVGDFQMQIRFVFGSKTYQLRLHNTDSDGKYRIQAIGGGSNIVGWSAIKKELTAAQTEKLLGDGLQFRIAIVDTAAKVYLDGELFATHNLTEAFANNGLQASDMAQIQFAMVGNNGENVEFSYALGGEPAKATVAVTGNENGTVTIDQPAYVVGETVKLTATPEEGYYLKSLVVKKNGQEVDIGAISMAGGTYTFTAEEGNYTVEAAFAKKIFQDNENYDLAEQHKDNLILKAGQSKETMVTTEANIYRGAAVTVSDLAPSFKDDGSGNFQAQIRFVFAGNEYHIRLHNTNTDGRYKLQSMGNSNCITGWSWIADLTAAQTEKLQSEAGVQFRVVLVGSYAKAFIDDTLMGSVDLSSGNITEDTTAQIRFAMCGNVGVQNIEIPFLLTEEQVAYSTVEVAGVENGTVKIDKTVLLPGEKATLTVTPNEGYYVKSLTVVNGNETVAVSKNSFVAGEEIGTYHVSVVFAKYTTVEISDAENGGVTADKERYTAGETVTITAKPNEGYNLKSLVVKKNGQTVEIGTIALSGGTYTFTAEEGSYTVEAEFAAPIFQDNENYDLAGQYEDKLLLKAGNNSEKAVVTQAKIYRDAAVTVSDLVPSFNAETGKGNFQAQIRFIFAGNEYHIRLHNTDKDGKYKLQSMGNTNCITGWSWIADLTAAQTEKLRSEAGVQFRVVLVGNCAKAFIDDKLMGSVDLSAGNITASSLAQVKFVMCGNDGLGDIAIPYELKEEQPVYSTVTVPAFTGGAVTVDKKVLVPGETATLTVTPNEGYYNTSIAVDGVSLQDKGNSKYTFVAGEGSNSYSVNAAFVKYSTVQISELTNGKVVADKDQYKNGDTVTLTATPEEGYYLKSLVVKKNGQEVNIGAISMAGGTYTFTAEEGDYTVEAAFAKKIFQDTENWDLSEQDDGVVTILQGYEKGRTLVTQANTYRDIAVTVKDYQKGTFKTEFHFVFGDGREFQIRLHNEGTNGAYKVQKMETTLSSGWKNLYTLNDEKVALLKGETGIEFRVSIIGTCAYAYLNDALVGQVDLTNKISATETAQVKIIIYGNGGEKNIAVPFALSSDPAHADVTVAEGITNGTIGVDKAIYAVGETVTVTAAPADDYNLKRLELKKDGQVVKTFETALAGGSYTFTAEKGTYTVEAEFALPIFNSNANWNLEKQYEGVLLIAKKGESSVSLTTKADTYRKVSVTVSDLMPSFDAKTGKGNFKMLFSFNFTNGKKFQVRIDNESGKCKDGEYRVLNVGISGSSGIISEWTPKYYAEPGSELATKLRSEEGVTFRAEIVGTNAEVYLDDTKVFTIDLSAGITTDTTASISLTMEGNIGAENIEIPFTLK